MRLIDAEQVRWQGAVRNAERDEANGVLHGEELLSSYTILAVDRELSTLRQRAEQANRENEALLGAWRLAVGVNPDCPLCHGKGGEWRGIASSCEAWHPCSCWILIEDQRALEVAEGQLAEVVHALVRAVGDGPPAERPVGWVQRLVGRVDEAEQAAKSAKKALKTAQAEHAELDKAREGRIEQLEAALRETVAAMRDYEMEVDESPPYKHRQMMQRADGLLAATTPTGQTPPGGRGIRSMSGYQNHYLPQDAKVAREAAETPTETGKRLAQETVAICADCGDTLQLVRPGKYQCDNCER